MKALNIAWFGSSLVSAYWNGAATYYRGIVKALADRGHSVEFFEPRAFDRHNHRDLADPDWARVTVFEPEEKAAAACLKRARRADVLIKSSGVGVLDEYLEREVTLARRPGTLVVFWDVDAPATLTHLQNNPAAPLRRYIPDFDLVLTYGGGPPVVGAYRALGARDCVPVYNALDPGTHFPVAPRRAFQASLSFLGNRLPDREARVAAFFLEAAQRLPQHRFLLGGSGWEAHQVPGNVQVLGHVYTRDHNSFNASPLAVLNLCRDSMASNGWSPATRVFEAAGAAACIITDAWDGLDTFLEPGREVLVAADGAELAALLEGLSRQRAREVGLAGRRRVLAEHTYAARAAVVERVFADGARQPAAAPLAGVGR